MMTTLFHQIINMPHFFINTKNITKDLVTIDDKENYQHIARSLRAKIGEKLRVIDENRIEYECDIIEITKSTIIAKIEKKYPSKNDLKFNLFLAQSPVKSDAQGLIIEKATELGIRGIYPIYTDFCTLSKNIIENKIPKWQKTMIEASKQCERASIPECFELTTLEKLLNTKKFDRILAFCERNERFSLKTYLTETPIKQGENVLVIIGPEGGFSAREFKFFSEHDIIMLTLGSLILKAETATIVALGNIVYEFSNNTTNC